MLYVNTCGTVYSLVASRSLPVLPSLLNAVRHGAQKKSGFSRRFVSSLWEDLFP